MSSKGIRDRDDLDSEEQSSKAQRVVAAAEVLQMALGEKSHGGVEPARRDPTLVVPYHYKGNEKASNDLPGDEGLWAGGQKDKEVAGSDDDHSLDDFLNQMFE